MIIPGILEKTLEEIQKKVSQVENVTQMVQIDIADGVFVNETTFNDITQLASLQTQVKFDVHLMVENPLPYVETLIQKVESINCHVEAGNVTEFIQKAKDLGYKVGLSLNPETPLGKLEGYIDQIDYVQFLGVIPGAQGREFKQEALEKIKEFIQKHPDTETWVDGGIDEETLPLVLNAGVNNVVIGSAIFRAENPKQALINFKERSNL